MADLRFEIAIDTLAQVEPLAEHPQDNRKAAAIAVAHYWTLLKAHGRNRDGVENVLARMVSKKAQVIAQAVF